jgi:hypothetical protein
MFFFVMCIIQGSYLYYYDISHQRSDTEVILTSGKSVLYLIFGFHDLHHPLLHYQGQAVAWLVVALCYKMEGCRFESQ